MFFDDPLNGIKKVFNELQINGIDEDDDDDLEDYTDAEYDLGDDEDDVDIDADEDDLEDYTDAEYDPDADDDTATDDTEDVPADDTTTEDQPTEEAPAEDAATTDDNAAPADNDAPDVDVDPEEDTTATDDAPAEDTNTDAPADDAGGDTPPADDAGGGDEAEPEIDDLTDGGNVDNENGDTEEGAEGEGGEDAGGEEGTDDTTAEDAAAETTEEEDPNSLKSLEKNLFDDLTPAQLAIKDSELLQNYIDLYDTINTILENVNKIPKTYYNTRAIDFIADKMIELKDMVNYTIITTYSTKTYIENLTTYKQCLLTLQQVNTMLKGLVQKRTEEENKE